MNRTSESRHTLVCTHGWKHDESVWNGLAGHLGAELDLHTWDLPEHGAEGPLSRPDEPVRFELVERLDQKLDDVDSDPVILVGHSLGGYVSLAHALAQPDRAIGLVLLSTGPGFSKSEAREQWNQWACENADPERPNQHRLVFHDDSEVLDRLSEIDLPTLVLVGERDKRFAAAREVFAAKLSTVESDVIAGAGHNVHLTHPAVVAEHIVRWLTSMFPDREVPTQY